MFRKNLLVLIILIMLFIVCLGEYIPGKYYHGLRKDNFYWFLPLKNYLSNTITSGHLPLRVESGYLNFFCNPFFSCFYPFIFLFLDIYSSPLDALFYDQIITLFHILLVLLFFYYFLRSLNLRKYAAILGTSVFTFSTWISIAATWKLSLYPLPWVILSLTAVIKILDEDRTVFYGLLYIISATLMILASPLGGIWIFFYVCLFLVLIKAPLTRIKQNYQKYAKLVLFTLAVILLTAHAVIPYLVRSGDYIRWISTGGKNFPVVGQSLSLPMDALTFMQLEVHELANVIHQFSPGGTRGSFLGLFVVSLMALSLVRVVKNKYILYFSLVTLLGLIFQLGSASPTIYLVSVLPLLNAIRYPWMYIYIMLTGASVLAAYGYQYLVSLPGKYKKIFIIISSAIAVVVIAVIAIYTTPPMNVYVQAVSLAVGYLILLLLFLEKKYIPYVVAILLSVNYIVLQKQHTVNPPESIEHSEVQRQELKYLFDAYDFLADRPDIKEFKTLVLLVKKDGFYKNSSASNLALYYPGIRVFGTLGSPVPFESFDAYMVKLGRDNYYALHGGKYAVTDMPNFTKFQSGYTSIYANQEYTVYENKKALPYVKIIKGEVYRVDDVKSFDIMKNEYDYTNNIFINKESDMDGLNLMEPGKISIHSIKRNVNEINVGLNGDGSGILLVNEHFKPEWKIKVDGKEREAFRINYNQIGIVVKKGDRVVTLLFHPDDYFLLLYLAGATFIIIIIIFIAAIIVKFQKHSRLI